MKDNPNNQFCYSEPKKLIEIENFILEFYKCVNPDMDLFFKTNNQLIYLEYSLLDISDEFVKNYGFYNNTAEIINKILLKFLDQYRFYNLKDSKVPRQSFLKLDYLKNDFLIDFFSRKNSTLDILSEGLNKNDLTMSLSRGDGKFSNNLTKLCNNIINLVEDEENIDNCLPSTIKNIKILNSTSSINNSKKKIKGKTLNLERNHHR